MTGITIAIRLTPKSDRDAVTGYEQTPDGPVIKARVRALPEKGKANTALIKLISKWLKLPKSHIELQSGSKSRIKMLNLSGDQDELQGILNEALDALKQ